MQLSKVDIKPIPNQTFKVIVTFDDKKQTFFLTFNYREVCEYWTMTIKDVYQNVLLSNIPCVTGGGLLEAGNLLQQFGYMALGSMLMHKTQNTSNDVPGPRDLGIEYEFYWGDTEVTPVITGDKI